MDEDLVWYFAYGSNLNKTQMKDRIGGWKNCERAFLTGYAIVFNVRSERWRTYTANIIPSNDVVYGAIYLISNDRLNILTKEYEHVSPTDVEVQTEDGRKVCAKTYIFNSQRQSMPTSDYYLNTIIEGLRQHKYDEKIIELIKNIAKRTK